MKKVLLILCYIGTAICYAAAVYSLIRGSEYKITAGLIAVGSVLLYPASLLSKKPKEENKSEKTDSESKN